MAGTGPKLTTAAALTSNSSTALEVLGTEYTVVDPAQGTKKYVYVRASTSGITVYDAVAYTSGGLATSVASGTHYASQFLGVAQTALTSSYYGWIQTYGLCYVNVKSSCAADVPLSITGATAGYLDDDYASAASGGAGWLGTRIMACAAWASGTAYVTARLM